MSLGSLIQTRKLQNGILVAQAYEEKYVEVLKRSQPVTVAEWSEASTVLARLDAWIVGSNPTRVMDVYVYVYVYSMFVLSCVGRGLAMSWSLVQGVVPTALD
jgi:hypothetical protein